MKLQRCDIVWSPRRCLHGDSMFAALTSADLALYECQVSPPISRSSHSDALRDGGVTKLAEDLYAVAVYSASEFNCSNVTSMSWCPSAELPAVLAIAKLDCIKVVNFELSKGTSTLTTMSSANILNKLPTVAGKELSMCTSIAWHPSDANWLVASFGRGKTFVWNTDVRNLVSSGSSSPVSDVHFAELELDNGESAQSIAWRYSIPTSKDSAVSAVVGTSKDRLKLIQLRHTASTSGLEQQLVGQASPTKAVHLVTAHPSNDSLVLSTSLDGVVHLWDVRNLAACYSVISSPSSRPVTKLAWAPVGSSNACVAAVLYRDAPSLRLATVFHVYGVDGAPSATEGEPFVADRLLSVTVPVRNFNLSSGPDNSTLSPQISTFSWHPSRNNLLITIVGRSQLVPLSFEDVTSLQMQPSNNSVLCSSRRRLITMHVDAHSNVADTQMDLTELIRLRLTCDYGFKLANPWGSLPRQVVTNHPLNILAKPFWKWLLQRHRLHSSVVSQIDAQANKVDLRGVCQVISLKSQPQQLQSASRSNSSRSLSLQYQREEAAHVRLDGSEYVARVYVSSERQLVARLCGWPSIDTGQVEVFVNSVAEDPAHTPRAAALALYLLKLPLALHILSSPQLLDPKSSNESMLPIVALALPGVLAVDAFSAAYESNMARVSEPYLKLLLSFARFVAVSDSLLYDDGILLEDRVAIAAMYLPDERFQRFIATLSRQLVNSGQLSGLLFTGLESSDFVRLVQNYVNTTADVQTVSMACAHAFANGLRVPSEIVTWTEAYRGLLNRLLLFRQRAAFDDFRRQLGVSIAKPRPTVSLGCGTCEKAVVQSVPLAGMQRVLPIYCQSCKRPLPRCAVCLTRVGDDGWITWCQSCRHGGHAHHLLQWFTQYTYCPVVECRCTCMQLDGPF